MRSNLTGFGASGPVAGDNGQELLTLNHSYFVTAVAFSPDGNRLATTSGNPFVADSMLIVWDATSGQELFKLQGSKFAFEVLAYSPDGKQLASAGRATSTVKIWDAVNGQELLALKGHFEAPDVRSGLGVNELDYALDGKRLASAGADSTVKVWDTSSGQELLTLKGHTGWVSCVAISPDGKQVASAAGYGDKRLKLWNSASGKELKALDHLGPVSDVAYSPKGNRLATVVEGGLVKLWDF